MKISSKGRYGFACMIYLARNGGSGENITVINISEKLGISKIYLEQVFSLLKRAALLTSNKGSQGGYRLSKKPDEISALQILRALEPGLFEKTEPTVAKTSEAIENVLQDCVFSKIDAVIIGALENISLKMLADETEKYHGSESIMFYI